MFTVWSYRPPEHSPLGSLFQCCLKKWQKVQDLTFRTALVSKRLTQTFYSQIGTSLTVSHQLVGNTVRLIGNSENNKARYTLFVAVLKQWRNYFFAKKVLCVCHADPLLQQMHHTVICEQVFCKMLMNHDESLSTLFAFCSSFIILVVFDYPMV